MKPDTVKEIRARLSLSQEELAASTGVSRATIARAEATGLGRSPLAILLRLFERHPVLAGAARKFAAEEGATGED